MCHSKRVNCGIVVKMKFHNLASSPSSLATSFVSQLNSLYVTSRWLFYVCLINFCLGMFCLHICLGTMYMPGAPGSRNRESYPLELDGFDVSHHVVLGIEPWSFGRAASALNCCSAISPTHLKIFRWIFWNFGKDWIMIFFFKKCFILVSLDGSPVQKPASFPGSGSSVLSSRLCYTATREPQTEHTQHKPQSFVAFSPARKMCKVPHLRVYTLNSSIFLQDFNFIWNV